jgi:hypothetical protein
VRSVCWRRPSPTRRPSASIRSSRPRCPLIQAARQLGLGERQPIRQLADAGELHRRLAARPFAAQHQHDEREEDGHGEPGAEPEENFAAGRPDR